MVILAVSGGGAFATSVGISQPVAGSTPESASTEASTVSPATAAAARYVVRLRARPTARPPLVATGRLWGRVERHGQTCGGRPRGEGPKDHP